jgi:hypothetical protein
LYSGFEIDITIMDNNSSCENHCCPTGHRTPPLLPLDEVRYSLFLVSHSFTSPVASSSLCSLLQKKEVLQKSRWTGRKARYCGGGETQEAFYY